MEAKRNFDTAFKTRVSRIGAKAVFIQLSEMKSMDITLKSVLARMRCIASALLVAAFSVASVPAIAAVQPVPAEKAALPIIVSPAQAQALIANGAKILDLRVAKDYDAGHIAGAISFPWRALNVAEVDGVRNEFASDAVMEKAIAGAGLTYDDTLLVYETTALPGRAYVMLEYIGFGGRIHVLDGGIRAWGGQLSKTPAKVATSDFRLTRKSDPRVDKAYVAGKVGAADVAIIDCRDEPAYVDGHIPGARNLPQSTLVTKQGTLQPAEEVTRLFRGAGVDGSKPVISYCGSGVYGANAFLAMRNQGYRNIVLYDGSWDEWSRDPNARQDSSLANYTIDAAGYKPAKGAPRFVDRKELQTAIDANRKGVVIVDVRAPADYDWGHIPTSVNVFWDNTVDANRKLLSEAELGAMYAKAGLSPDKRVIIYARGGYQLTHTYTVLSMLGYKDVDFYNGKFEGWKAK